MNLAVERERDSMEITQLATNAIKNQSFFLFFRKNNTLVAIIVPNIVTVLVKVIFSSVTFVANITEGSV